MFEFNQKKHLIQTPKLLNKIAEIIIIIYSFFNILQISTNVQESNFSIKSIRAIFKLSSMLINVE